MTRFYHRVRLPVLTLLSMALTLLLLSSVATGTASAATRPPKQHHSIHPATVGVGYGPASVAVGDFNGDHIPDLAVANGDDGTVSILLSNGDGTFTSNTVRVTGQNFNATAGTSFTGTVASVIGAEQASDLSATIDWGDGSPTSSGTVSGTDPYGITGTHTYSMAGNYTVTISVADSNLNSISTGTATAMVAQSISLTLTGQSVSATEGAIFNGVVATGTENGISGNLSATINWGDGSNSSGTISGTTSFTVNGSHTYAEEGTYSIGISVTDNNGHSASATSPAAVNDATLTLTHFVAGPLGHRVAGLGATFTDADPAGLVADYTATINWGDGTTVTVRVVKNPQGKGFVLAGLHRYAKPGTYSVTLTVRDSGGSQLSKAVTFKVK